MGFNIVDGLGSGREAAVDVRHRLQGAVTTETESNYHTSIGLKYNINTGPITFTSAAKTTVFYLKNNDNRPIIVDALVYNCGANTGGSGDRIISVIKNPTQGNIITNANNVPVGITSDANLNFGSFNRLIAQIYKGAQGETPVTDGSEMIITRDPSPSGRIIISPGGGLFLPRGSAMALDYTPSTGTTNQVCNFALNVYVRSV